MLGTIPAILICLTSMFVYMLILGARVAKLDGIADAHDSLLKKHNRTVKRHNRQINNFRKKLKDLK